MRFILFSIVVHCIISTVAWLHLKYLSIYLHCVQKKVSPLKDFATTCANLHQIKYTVFH